MNDTLKGVAIVVWLIKKFREHFPSVQLGKTAIQKLLYILTLETPFQFDYTLYHYGPYSSEVSLFLSLAESLNLIQSNWDPDKGYDIYPTEKQSGILNKLKEDELNSIESLVKKYGKLNPLGIKLSIIATSKFLEKELNIKNTEELIETLKSLKPQLEHKIVETLSEAEAINRPRSS